MKKVIYIEIDEEITSIYDRVKRAKQKIIHLIVPRKAIIFQSLVNLKILKRKVADLGKKIILVTSDHRGRHLAKQVKIEVISQLDVKQRKAKKGESAKKSIEPMQARRNEIIRDTPKRYTEKKVTIRELIKDHREKQKKRKTDSEALPGMTLVKPSKKLFGLILILSIGLFGLISYVALPGATIYIKPKFDDISHTVNITLADKRKNQNLLRQNKPNVIPSEVITIEIRQTKIFNVTSKEFEGENATGIISIINSTQEPWDLKEETRFKTDDGVIFRIKKGLTVPAAFRDETGEYIHGRIDAKVVADPFDAYGEPAGKRGNIGPSKLTIPALTKYNQRLIWAENSEPMVGGVTKYYKVVKKEDIESAKKQIKDNLIFMAKEDLRTRISEMNKLNSSNLALLDDRRYLNTNVISLKVSDDLLGSRKEKFEVFAKIEAKGIAYDQDQLFAILKKELSKRSHPDMQIRESSVNPDSITYEVIDEDKDLGKIKITATIVGIEEFVIDSKKEAGQRFGSIIKEKIVNMPVKDAENLIQNLPEVDAVSIKTWPFWVSNIPRIPDNISIKLMQDN